MPIPLNFPITQFLAMKPSAKVAVPDAVKTDLLAPFITSALDAATKATKEYRDSKNFQEEVNSLADYYDKKGLTDLSGMLRSNPSLAPNYGGAIAGENTQAKRERVLAGVTALAGQEMRFNEEKLMNKDRFEQHKELQNLSQNFSLNRDDLQYYRNKAGDVMKIRVSSYDKELTRVAAELEAATVMSPGPDRDSHVKSLLDTQKELNRLREAEIGNFQNNDVDKLNIVPPVSGVSSKGEDRNTTASILPSPNERPAAPDATLLGIDNTPVINPADKTIPRANIVPDSPTSQSTENQSQTPEKSTLDKSAEREAEAARIRMKQSDSSRSATKDIVSSHLFSNEAMLKANTDNGKLTPDVASAFQSSIETAKKLIAAGNYKEAEKILSELDTQIPKNFDPSGTNKRKEYTSIGDNLFGPINDQIEAGGEARIDLAVDSKGDIYVAGGASPKYTKIESGGDGNEDIKDKILGYLASNVTTSNRDEILKDLGVKVKGRITPNMIRELAKKAGGSVKQIPNSTPGDNSSITKQPLTPESRASIEASLKRLRPNIAPYSRGDMDYMGINFNQ